MAPTKAREIAIAKLGNVGLGPDIAELFPSELSGGMQKRVALARAIAATPDILFFDEPTTGLDPISRARVWGEVRRLNDELGTTVFLTTQYLEEADALADRVGIIDRGRLVAEGTPAALKKAVGSDLIVARVAGDAASVAPALRRIPGVRSVEARADELVVALATVKKHVSHVLDKLGAANRTQAVARARELGLLR